MKAQFRLDVPRLELYLNTSAYPLDTKNPDKVWDVLCTYLDNDKVQMTRLAYYCTQACLGDMYIDESLMLEEGESILSSPKHIVQIIIKNKKNWNVKVTRDFRLAYLSENCGEVWELDIINFTMYYDSTTQKEYTDVKYNANNINKMGNSDILNSNIFF